MAPPTKKVRKELIDVQKGLIWARYLDGDTPTSIATKTKHPRSTITSFINRTRLLRNPTFENKPRSGRTPKATPRDERSLLRHANLHTKDTLRALGTPSKSSHQICINTVKKILLSYGKAKRKPRTKPFVSGKNKIKRLAFAKSERALARNYNRVCWSDEVTFHVGEDNNTCYVTRGPGEEWEEKNLKPSFKSGRTSLGVWSCYCGDKMGPLVVIPKGGTMTAERYLETVQKHFLPFYRRMKRKYGASVIMQEDNASWHTAKVVRAYMATQKIKLLQWPPQSPDLSPIENLWKYIKNIIGKKRHLIKNIVQMEVALREVWPLIAKTTLLKLNASIHKRIATVIKRKGGPTKY